MINICFGFCSAAVFASVDQNIKLFLRICSILTVFTCKKKPSAEILIQQKWISSMISMFGSHISLTKTQRITLCVLLQFYPILTPSSLSSESFSLFLLELQPAPSVFLFLLPTTQRSKSALQPCFPSNSSTLFILY